VGQRLLQQLAPGEAVAQQALRVVGRGVGRFSQRYGQDRAPRITG